MVQLVNNKQTEVAIKIENQSPNLCTNFMHLTVAASYRVLVTTNNYNITEKASLYTGSRKLLLGGSFVQNVEFSAKY